jgi:hypothetical protein
MPSINGFELPYLKQGLELLHTCGADPIFRLCPVEPSVHVGSCYSVEYECIRYGSTLHPFSGFRTSQNWIKNSNHSSIVHTTQGAYPVECHMRWKRDEQHVFTGELSLNSKFNSVKNIEDTWPTYNFCLSQVQILLKRQQLCTIPVCIK